MIIITLLFLSVLGLLLFYTLLRSLQRLWWDPIRIQKMMEAQGIKGPPYKFPHGSSKEAAALVEESLARPMEGLSHDIAPRVQPHLHTWVKSYGKNLLQWRGQVPQLLVSEPELIKEILINREGAYIKAPPSKYMKKLIGDGLVTANGQKWVRQRKLANHAFRAENLKGMIPAIVASVEDMLTKWEKYNGSEVNLFREFQILSSDVISRTAFSSSYMQGKEIYAKLGQLARISGRNANTVHFPLLGKIWQTSDDKEADIAESEIRENIIRLVKQREESNRMGDPDGYGSDYLGSLLKANHESNENERITLEDIIDECKTFHLAGHDTTTAMLSWTALLLAINTEWQDKARQEAIDLFGNRAPTSNDTNIARLKKMTMILNESLRLYPPVVLLTRKVARDTNLGKLILPADLELHISPLIVQHDTQLWGEDAHLFKPERFAEGVAGATNYIASFLPFGSGPRLCVGQNLAMIEAKIALSMILQSYSFTLSPAYVHAPIRVLTTQPQYGLQVILHKL